MTISESSFRGSRLTAAIGLMLVVLGALAMLLTGSKGGPPPVVPMNSLPERARGGHFWRMREEKKTALRSLQVGSTAEKWLTQVLDHENANSPTFQQKYFEDLTYWDSKNGPIFLYIGGEGPLSGTPTGYIPQLAWWHSAAIIALEHRFYGDSVPDNDFSVANLQYLTVEQALADLAAFVQKWRTDHSVQASQKVITFGGSYAGALSAWFRQKYASTTAGSLASSGVVNAILDFPQFDTHISEALSTGVQADCLQIVKDTTTAFVNALTTGGATRDAAMRLFGDGVEDLMDEDFYYMIADSSAMAVQYGHKNLLCDSMVDGDAQFLMSNFANFTIKYWGAGFPHDCFYDTSCLANATESDRWQPTARAWRWQKCSQLAYFQVAPAQGSIRATAVDLQYHFEQCTTIFGITEQQTRDAVTSTNNRYGGVSTPAGTTNIFFSQFSDDPWLEAGITQSAPSLPAFTANCDLCGHCQDLHAPLGPDPSNLARQRQYEASVIGQWLQ